MALGQTLETAFSGSSYHLACAGMAEGSLQGCFSLSSAKATPRRVQIHGALWKLARSVRREGKAGFKFTSVYLNEVWPRYVDVLAGATLISNFQLYGSEFFRRRRQLDIGAYFYVDGTLTEYFESYGQYDMSNVDTSTMKQAIQLEQAGYELADGIVVMSKLSALTLQQRYGIPSDKISIVIPGANLADEVVDRLDISSPEDSDEFVLGFVGLYPLRKGLDRLAAALQILRGRGLHIRLRVIGNCPADLQTIDGLDYLGVISKTKNPDLFVQKLRGVHLGCLLSRSELAGVAMLEFLRLGVPILGTRVGGATDILEGGGSLGVSPDIEPEELAEVIAGIYHDRSQYSTIRAEAANRSAWASWTRAARELEMVLP
jgi:glycosyltransferase involved in cell wall biosynthesis